MSVPAKRHRISARSFTEENPPIEYAADELTRSVKSKGEITFQNRFYCIGSVFCFEVVALRSYGPDNCYRVCFGAISLGYIYLSVSAFKPKGHYQALLPRPPSVEQEGAPGVLCEET